MFIAPLHTAITFVGLISSIILIADWIQSAFMIRRPKFPLVVRQKVSSRTYNKVIDRFVRYLDDNRMAFDVVIGIHYGGIGVASDLAARRHRPFRLIETYFRTEGKVITCENVIPHFKKSDVKGKTVLLVDNRIRSGRTLKMAKAELEKAGAQSVHTVVLFRPQDAQSSADYVIFKAGRWFRNRDFRK